MYFFNSDTCTRITCAACNLLVLVQVRGIEDLCLGLAGNTFTHRGTTSCPCQYGVIRCYKHPCLSPLLREVPVPTPHWALLVSSSLRSGRPSYAALANLCCGA